MKTLTKEQEICVNCGMCCDNTLFDYVKIYKSDPYQNGEWEIIEKGEANYLNLPCPFFDGRCTVYDNTPKRCKEFRCEVLKKVEGGELNQERAEKMIAEIIQSRNQILNDYKTLKGEKITFRQLSQLVNETKDSELAALSFKVDLLNIQLSKHFRTEKKFSDIYAMID